MDEINPEYERGFKDGLKSECLKELKPIMVGLAKGCTEAIKGIAPMLIDAAQLTITQSANCWIPCSERMPEQDGEYLVFTEYEDVFKCTFDSNEENKWGFEQNYHDPDTLGWAGTTWTAVETVTHWMPLPEPPEEE